MAKTDGKKLERDIYVALKHFGARASYGQTEMLPVDRIAFLPPSGRGVAIECKECRSDRFDFRRLTTGERGFLATSHEMGAISLLAIQRVYLSSSRTWVIRWADLVELWPALVGSFSLADGRRPMALLELERVTRPNSLGTAWDLGPVLR